jgi:serine/threonine-protein kinase
VGLPLFGAALVWVLYLAIEPWVRRQSPHQLISWTRLVSGGWRDPIVGRDVLIGTCGGAAMAILIAVSGHVEAAVGAPSRPKAFMLQTLLGTREALSGILDYGFQAVAFSMGFLLLLLLLRVVLRRDWLAGAATAALLGTITGLNSGVELWPGLLIGVLLWIIPTFVLLRFGLLAATVGLLVIFLVGNLPLTSRLDHWTAGPTHLVLVVVAALAVAGFRTALGGRSLLGEALDG